LSIIGRFGWRSKPERREDAAAAAAATARIDLEMHPASLRGSISDRVAEDQVLFSAD